MCVCCGVVTVSFEFLSTCRAQKKKWSTRQWQPVKDGSAMLTHGDREAFLTIHLFRGSSHDLSFFCFLSSSGPSLLVFLFCVLSFSVFVWCERWPCSRRESMMSPTVTLYAVLLRSVLLYSEKIEGSILVGSKGEYDKCGGLSLVGIRYVWEDLFAHHVGRESTTNAAQPIRAGSHRRWTVLDFLAWRGTRDILAGPSEVAPPWADFRTRVRHGFAMIGAGDSCCSWIEGSNFLHGFVCWQPNNSPLIGRPQWCRLEFGTHGRKRDERRREVSVGWLSRA